MYFKIIDIEYFFFFLVVLMLNLEHGSHERGYYTMFCAQNYQHLVEKYNMHLM